MSAKELVIYMPRDIDAKPMLNYMVKQLGLRVDELPANKDFSFQFSAQSGEGRSYVLLEYKKYDLSVIREISLWRRPSEEYKKIIMGCVQSITIYYREQGRVKDALMVIGDWLKDVSNICIVENGYGCLLTLESVINSLSKNIDWSWEKNEFPEVPGVAASEWM